jgi:hypothetical protein
MAIATPKYELLIDLSKPVDELLACIVIIANTQPGKQLEILQQVELRLGEQIQAIENGLKETTQAEQNNKT